MPQHRRPSAAAVLLLLLAVVFCPSLAGAGPFASGPGKGAAASKVSAAAVQSPASGAGAEARPHAVDAFGTGGTCKQQDAPLSGTQAAVAHAHNDPLTGPGATRTALPEGHAPRPGAPRAPPVPVAGCAELLPVLRI
ncbi:hypothetical protein [Streptomyces blastmyceticus]|uniref:Secreted protein n=1 Tax=Streptomyces blastmyceticus TaxID=68180 RepID=A0ABN0WA79_9ACTN